MPDKQASVAAVMSIPRLGWNDHWGCVYDVLGPLGIPVHRASGALWEQMFERVMSVIANTGVDYLLTIDYDTMFTRAHLLRLWHDMLAHPDVDALAAVQLKRMCPKALGKELGPRGLDGIQPMMSAHFGFTLLRAEKLRRMKKPWFWGQPHPEDGWSTEDKMDPDVFFWKKWQENGNTVCSDTNVRVGQLELMVSVLADDGPRYIHVTEWNAFQGDTQVLQSTDAGFKLPRMCNE